MVKLKEKGFKGQGNIRYKNTIDFKNPSNLALLFSDLEIHGANIIKAFEKFKKEKAMVQGFPW